MTSQGIKKKIGLLLGDEEDWPRALELLARRYSEKVHANGARVDVQLERVRIHPFALTDDTSYHLVIDRLAWWHPNPREWLKKAALVNRVYLLNNPFTFQSMEKHSAYCAMIRLGLHIPTTWLIPQKQGPDTEKYRRTAAKYHDFFDLPAIARQVGYPLYMKPFDGGGWRGVSRIDDEQALVRAYDESGQMMMHLQKGLDFDVFVRSLGIGPQIISLQYDPSKPMHDRYTVTHGFLSERLGWEARAITKIVNAVFRWEFNSCEALVVGDELWPIDYANACPDIAITSLHYYFPWAITSLLAWSLFCLATERRCQITMDLERYFAIADSERSYEEKLKAYEKLADDYFDSERFFEFRHSELADLDEVMWELVQTSEFEQIVVDTVRSTFPAHEHDHFIGHFRGLLGHWVASEAAGRRQAAG